MKKVLMVLCAVMLVFGVVGSAGAKVITFDDVPGANSNTYDNEIPDGYGELNWDYFYVLHKDLDSGSGYDNGVVSGEWVAYNYGAHVATVEGGPFDFNGAYLTAAWINGLNINIKGYNSGNMLYDQTIVVYTTGPTWFDANFLGIDKLVFESSGGGWDSHFAMDNFTYNESAPVPIPSTVLLLGSGLLGFATYGRKHFRKKA